MTPLNTYSKNKIQQELMLTADSYTFTKPWHLCNPHGWIPHIPFAFFLTGLLQPHLFVELGTYSGNSYFAFCQAVKQMKLPAKCYAVDTWKGDIHVGNYAEEVFQRVETINRKTFSGFSSLLRIPFHEALSGFAANTIDLLHIDGTHTYEAVKQDFETWLPKMSSRGVMLLHDTQVKKEGFAVGKFFDEIKTNYPHMEFTHSEGLAVIATGGKPDNKLMEFFDKANHDPMIKKTFELAGNTILLQREKELFRQEAIKFKKKSSRLNTTILEKNREIKKLKKALS